MEGECMIQNMYRCGICMCMGVHSHRVVVLALNFLQTIEGGFECM